MVHQIRISIEYLTPVNFLMIYDYQLSLADNI